MAAFEAIYKEYAPPVYRFLLSLSGSQDQAEELLQETFYQAFQHIDRFEGRCSLYTWLCRIGKNAWLKECRRSKRYSTTPWEELTLPSEQSSPEAHAIAREDYERLLRAMEKLEDPYKDVFILHALGGIRLKEIASLYEKSESWARVTYFRAKQQIAQEVLP